MLRWRTAPVIEDKRPTIASLLKERGYRTAMVGKWHLGFEQEDYDSPLTGGPIDRGFDSFFGIHASTDIPPYYYIRGDRAVQPPTERIESNRSEGWSPIQGAFWRGGPIAPGFELEKVLPELTDEAVSILEDHADTGDGAPLLLYLAYPAPHTPWLPSAEFDGVSRAGLYGDFVAMVDTMVGRVLRALERTGMSDETMVIFASDNGPVWYDRDIDRFGHDSAGGLRGMKGDAWEAGHRIPFVVRWPGHARPGSESDRLVSFVDVMATLAEATDTLLPENAGPDSFSFLSALRPEGPGARPARQNLAVQAISGMMAIRSASWKLVAGRGSGGFSDRNRDASAPDAPDGQLYNLADDPAERVNLYRKHPEIVDRLERELARIQNAPRSRP